MKPFPREHGNQYNPLPGMPSVLLGSVCQGVDNAFYGQLLLSFDCRYSLALAHLGRLFIEFATAHLCQQTSFFADALEPAQSHVKVLVFLYLD